MPTDPRWVNIVEKNLEEILTDHAYCEQKAATNAISIIVKHGEHPELVKAMIDLAKEELDHFNMVHQKLIDRGYKLGFDRKDPYVGDLIKYLSTQNKGNTKDNNFVNKMMFSAMIEARSCERFKILSEELQDADLRNFYRELMESEARHYTMFISFARKYSNGIDVDARWQQFLDFEATLMEKYGRAETVHG